MNIQNSETRRSVTPRAARLLLGLSSAILALGGIAHAGAFQRALAALRASNLDAFIGQDLKVLWLSDSTTLLILAGVFGWIAARPSAARGSVVAALALVPAATGFLIYVFLGGFYAGHLLVIAGLAAFLAALRLSVSGLSHSASLRARGAGGTA